MNEREIFSAALEKPSVAERSAFLDAACRGDGALRQRLDELLREQSDLGSFLESHAATPESRESLAIDQPPLERPGMSIGPYKLLQPIGEGGMGTVWMAEQQAPVNRTVALKVVKAGMDSKQVLARFGAERQALALMDHPNIAKVLDAGSTDQGRPFFVMELVRGVPITQFCDVKRLTPRERLELFIPVCQAVQHAHQKGIIHRDLKPSNVLVGRYDGEPVPKIIDFGVAKAVGQKLSEATLFTEFGAVMGTPNYMSPEQRHLDNVDIDTRSDIYSLGVMLYELLTGTTPLDRNRFKEAVLLEVLRVIREEEPQRPSARLATTKKLTSIAACRSVEPRRLSALVHGELDWIVMKALEKDRTRRYETASALARDIRRYLADEPVQAGPPSTGYRLRKFVRRNPALTALGVMSGVVVLAVVGMAIALYMHASLLRSFRAETEARARAEEFQYLHHITMAHAEWQYGNPGRVETLLDDSPTNQRNWEWYYLKRLCHAELLNLEGHTDVVKAVAYSPDGLRLASGSMDGTVRLWDARTGREILSCNGHTLGVLGVAFNPMGSQLASASGDRSVKVWDTTNGQEIVSLLGHTFGILSVAYSPNGRLLAAAGMDGTVQIWETRSWQLVLPLPAHQGWVFSVAFSPDGTRLATASRDRTIKVWDLNTGKKTLTLVGHENEVCQATFSPDGSRIASGSEDRSARIWDASTGQEIMSLRGHISDVRSVAFSPDGSWLASASLDATLKTWDLATGREMLSLKSHTNGVSFVVVSPDGTHLASASRDHTVRVWDARDDREAMTLRAHTSRVWTAVFNPDGTRLASACQDDGTIRIWDVETGQNVSTLEGHSAGIESVDFSSDGTRLASASYDQTVRIWDVERTREVLRLYGHKGDVFGVSFRPGGKQLASGGADCVVRIWDAVTGQEVRRLTGHIGCVIRVAYNPGGTHLASASLDETVRIWDAVTGELLLTLHGYKGPMYVVAFSPDGKFLAAAGEEGSIKISNALTGEEVCALRGHTSLVSGLTFTSDGTRLASASGDHTIKLWDLRTRQEVLTLRSHTSAAKSVVFSPDGSRLASSSWDHTVKVWDARPLTSETPVEREGLGLVRFLFDRPLRRVDVMEYLRNAPTISTRAQEKALALAGGFAEATDPEVFRSASWAILRNPFLNSYQYGFALRQAQAACQMTQDKGKYLTNLGVAQYRVANWKEAIAALNQSMKPRNGGDCVDWFFLAMAHQQLGGKEEARRWYDRAVHAMEKNNPMDEELRGFRKEAAELLGTMKN